MENSYIKFWMENGILFSEYKTSVELNYERMNEVIAMRHEISIEQPQYWCYDINKLKSISKEARDYAEKNGQDYLHACATVVNSTITKFLFNTFLKLKKPVIPFQVFKNKEDAVKWLSELKRKNETT